MADILNVPVSPFVRNDGVIASLASLAAPALISQSGNAPKVLPDALDTEFRSQLESVSTAISVGFGSLASIEVGGDAQYFIAEFRAKCPPVAGKPGTIIAKEHYGAGFRICVKAWNLSAKAKLNIYGVAAECTNKTASSSYEIAFLGIDLKELGAVASFVGSSVGPFDASAIQRLGALIAATEDVLLTNASSIRPVLFSVDLDMGSLSLPAANMFSTSFALQSIARAFTLDQALAAIPKDVPDHGAIDPKVVGAVYGEVLGTASTVVKPVAKDQEKAKGLLFWGE